MGVRPVNNLAGQGFPACLPPGRLSFPRFTSLGRGAEPFSRWSVGESLFQTERPAFRRGLGDFPQVGQTKPKLTQ